MSRDMHDRCLRACGILRQKLADAAGSERDKLQRDHDACDQVAAAWAMNERPPSRALRRARLVLEELVL